MKRVLFSIVLVLAVSAPVFAGAPPAPPAQTGIVFDEVMTYYAENAPIPAPSDFDTVFERVRSDLAQHANESKFTRDTKYGQVFRIAIFGDLERLDVPGSPVYRIYNNKAKWIKIVDTQKHAYVRETMPGPQVYSVPAGKSISPSPRPSPWPDAEAKLAVDNTTLPQQTVGGLSLSGATSTVIARVDTATCRAVQLRADLTTYATASFVEPSPGNLYEAPFAFQNLTSGSQCNVPDFTKQAAALLPTYPHFIVLSARSVVEERVDQDGRPLPLPRITQVTIRAHVRALHASDRAALFDTPQGYKWDPSLAD